MNPSLVELWASVLFALALVHTFSVKTFEHWAKRCKPGSALQNAFELLGEVEIVFGVWAAVFIGGFALLEGGGRAVAYLGGLNFTEPVFVFAIMAVASTKPVLDAANRSISFLAARLPVPAPLAYYSIILVLGPLLGSLITEPAAMTVTALLLKRHFYGHGLSKTWAYATLAVLFVNISIGGTLTPYAAPPILMVASTWQWGLLHMLTHFGWRGAGAVVANACLITFVFRKELLKLSSDFHKKEGAASPAWLVVIHLLALACVAIFSHHIVLFLGVFLFFLGGVSVSREHQAELNLRPPLLVAFFLAGLVVLGTPQRWWLAPLLADLSSDLLFFSTVALTGIIDNAAITYLGAQVPDLSELAKYALVAGSVTGGGLTVIANAPNPAGYSILNSSFGEEGISPWGLFAAACPPTAIAAAWFWFNHS